MENNELEPIFNIEQNDASLLQLVELGKWLKVLVLILTIVLGSFFLILTIEWISGFVENGVFEDSQRFFTKMTLTTFTILYPLIEFWNFSTVIKSANKLQNKALYDKSIVHLVKASKYLTISIPASLIIYALILFTS